MGVLARALTLGTLLFAFFGAGHARAHLGHIVQQAERYVKVDVSGYHVRLVVSLTLGPRETVRVMQQADTDGNGWVSPEESDVYMRLWGQGLREELVVSVDGRPVEVVFGEPFMQPVGPIVATEGAVELVGSFVLDGGVQTIAVADRMRIETFDRTDFAFRARDQSELLASGIGADAVEPLEHASVRRDAPYPQAFMLRVRAPRRPLTATERAERALPWTSAVVGVSLFGVLVSWLKRRRRAARPTR